MYSGPYKDLDCHNEGDIRSRGAALCATGDTTSYFKKHEVLLLFYRIVKTGRILHYFQIVGYEIKLCASGFDLVVVEQLIR
jgi:hypothetical protein